MKRCISVIGLLGVLSLTACGGGSGGTGGTDNTATGSAGNNPPTNTYNPTQPDNSGGDTVVDGTSNAPGTPGGPGANNDDYQLIRNQTLEIASDAGVLSNDGVDDVMASQVSVETQPGNGTVELAVDGSFIYTPEPNFTGVDTFTYRLTDQNGQEGTAEVTLTVTEEDVVDNGFTPIIASEDTRTVYVSSSEGLDSNDGLSIQTPVKTLDKAFSLTREGYPDHVLLKRGDTWVDERLSGVKSGRSAEEPTVVAFYGESGDRPYLKTSTTSLTAYKLYNVNIIGLHIEAYKLNPNDPAFDGKTSANIRMGGDYANILFEDLKLRYVEFVIQGWGGGVARNITIRRSMILDKYSAGTSYTRDSRPSGIYTDHGEGLLVEDNVWDHNGWNPEVSGAGANMYNHNMYISEKSNVGNKVIVRNNIVTRGSSHGVQGRPGGLYENNFFARNAVALGIGNGDVALAEGTFAYVRNNVVTEGLSMRRGIDNCSGTNLCTGAIWGIQLENLGQGDVRVERNIVANRLPAEGSIYAEGLKVGNEPATLTDNIVYQWNDDNQGVDGGYPDPERTLADYNASLGGEESFEAFMEVVRNRPLQTWDPKYSAEAVNNYIRAGFGLE